MGFSSFYFRISFCVGYVLLSFNFANILDLDQYPHCFSHNLEYYIIARIWVKSGEASADPEGGQGVRTPPGKSQVIWVSIGNKQLDPPWK